MKTCTKCEKSKPLTDFYSCQKGKYGRKSVCKECGKREFEKWKSQNKDRFRALQKEWATKNKVRIAKRVKDAGYKWQKKWAEANIDTVRARQAARQERIRKATPTWADREKIERVYRTAVEYREMGLDVEVDHVIPVKGKLVCGLHVETNLKIVFAWDNRAKGNRFTIE